MVDGGHGELTGYSESTPAPSSLVVNVMSEIVTIGCCSICLAGS